MTLATYSKRSARRRNTAASRGFFSNLDEPYSALGLSPRFGNGLRCSHGKSGAKNGEEVEDFHFDDGDVLLVNVFEVGGLVDETMRKNEDVMKGFASLTYTWSSPPQARLGC